MDDFRTYYCMTVDGDIAPSDNFCKAVNGAVLPSIGKCCIRSSDFKTHQALSKGCADNGLMLGPWPKVIPCDP
ncbi:hypothetical protein CORC01_02650 [Colletotrichum orchidophilum]|uniref:Uncharacterized protein n=1 Tax=Colletotrichum orchidophilum TaxID=1209926 RepID=A0A1G4BKV2_9PEZI|nr:uncharacterized protein CORC01_02650 [Colletotrichum orchidophilum]OHF02071.1 hypothetical protein CORC01_02650 [Colletotrichum orchidophilum]